MQVFSQQIFPYEYGESMISNEDQVCFVIFAYLLVGDYIQDEKLSIVLVHNLLWSHKTSYFMYQNNDKVQILARLLNFQEPLLSCDVPSLNVWGKLL